MARKTPPSTDTASRNIRGLFSLCLPSRGRLIVNRTHHGYRHAHPSKANLFDKTLIRHFFFFYQSLTLAVGLLSLAMSKSALELILVLTVCLIALSPAVPVTTRFSAANLSAVAVDAEVEDSATRGVPTDASTNNEDQGGEPL